MAGRGLAALLDELQHRDISAFNPRRLPANGRDAAHLLGSCDSVAQWLFECLDTNSIADRDYQRMTAWNSRQPVAKAHIYCSYQGWCERNGERLRENAPRFWQLFRRYLPGLELTETRPRATNLYPRPRSVVLPELTAARLAWAHAIGADPEPTWRGAR
jgi:hypothetical protein